MMELLVGKKSDSDSEAEASQAELLGFLKILESKPILHLKKREDLSALFGEDLDAASDLFRRLILLYHRDAPTSMLQIKTAIAQANDFEIRRISHRFKSSNSNLGLERMTVILQTLEDGLLAKNQIQKVFQVLETELNLALSALTEFATRI